LFKQDADLCGANNNKKIVIMKKTILSMLLALTVMFSVNAKASRGHETPSSAVTYAGVTEKGIAFDLVKENMEGKTEVIIKDGNGDIIYHGNFTGQTIKSRFFLPKDAAVQQYTFVIINGGSRFEKKFFISTSFVEKTTVEEVK
jgi:hypothetical protein